MYLPAAASLTFTGPQSVAMHARSTVKSDARSSLGNGFSFWAVEQSLGYEVVWEI